MSWSSLLHPRYWHARMQLVTLVASMLAVTVGEPASILHQIIGSTGRHGWFWVGLLIVVTALAAVDILINDVLPDRISLGPLKNRRYLVYMALSMGLISLCAVIVIANGTTSVLLVWLVPGFGAAHLAITDFYLRHQGRLIQSNEEKANAVEVH
ncbi:hypothetical protein EC845_1208 [Comamonas sp. BIGb0124]|uniref:hypothetical protein n=1 Tax=Comamonas sp. BIGb0124 TaxID=2485130 RepID=UPI000F474358|nr:hypothetical protein [Comamonas sp. BIGb0124]ROR25168.1 hypothetical protein EC845_1208 [Comamonas sp. BIGb0124]